MPPCLVLAPPRPSAQGRQPRRPSDGQWRRRWRGMREGTTGPGLGQARGSGPLLSSHALLRAWRNRVQTRAHSVIWYMFPTCMQLPTDWAAPIGSKGGTGIPIASASSGYIGKPIAPSWSHLWRPFGTLLGPSWGHLGAISGPLGASWAPLGAIFQEIDQKRRIPQLRPPLGSPQNRLLGPS